METNRDIQQLQQQISELTSLVKSMSVVLNQQSRTISTLEMGFKELNLLLNPPKSKYKTQREELRARAKAGIKRMYVQN